MPFIAEQGMIALTEVTLDNMKAAVNHLHESGFIAVSGNAHKA